MNNYVVSYVVPGPPPRRVYEFGHVMAGSKLEAIEIVKRLPRVKSNGGLWRKFEATPEEIFDQSRARLESDVIDYAGSTAASVQVQNKRCPLHQRANHQ